MSGVALGYVHGNDVAYSWHRSVRQLEQIDLEIPVRYGTGGIVAARNAVVADFLTTELEWLLWTDTDMGFAPDTVTRLLACDVPIVGGLTFAAREVDDDGMGGHRIQPAPVLFKWSLDDDGFVPWLDYPRDRLVQVAGTGSALILVHRSVFEHIAGAVGPRWYDPMTLEATGGYVGEDLAFCARCTKAGIPIFVHTGVLTTHQKTVWLGEADYRGGGGSGGVRSNRRPQAAASKGGRRKPRR